MLPLIGVAVVVIGFALRLNALLVIVCAALATGLAAGMPLLDVVATFGKAFADSRFVTIIWLVLPVIGLLERAGLKERARVVIAKLRAATAGRVLLVYLAVRQITSALGLTSLGGHPQMVRPLLAPMAEAAAEQQFGALPAAVRMRIRAFAAATDNIGLFFGEDVFIAIGSILLMVGFLQQAGIVVAPARLALWAMPTAIFAFVIHGARLLLLDGSLRRQLASLRAAESDAAARDAAAGNAAERSDIDARGTS